MVCTMSGISVLLNAAVVFTFSLLYSIPLYGYAEVTSYCVIVGHLGYFLGLGIDE